MRSSLVILQSLVFASIFVTATAASSAASRRAASQTERNNWAVIVETSRYFYNYRHVSNALSFYHTVKRLGIPDSQIILMLSEDMACSPRNARPGNVYGDENHRLNLYGEHVEVDYRGDEVSVENFLRLLTGRHPPNTPRNKRLLTDSMSNVFMFITGHSGEEFIKFQDWEEITSNDIADAFQQMHSQKRYRQILWTTDTCQAATLQNQFYAPEVLAMANSGKGENGYSHHVDHDIGVAIIDRFTYYSLDFMNSLTTKSTVTIDDYLRSLDPAKLHANPEIRSDLFSRSTKETLLTEFLASTGKMRFQNSSMELAADSSAVAAQSADVKPALNVAADTWTTATRRLAPRTEDFTSALADGPCVLAAAAWVLGFGCLMRAGGSFL